MNLSESILKVKARGQTYPNIKQINLCGMHLKDISIIRNLKQLEVAVLSVNDLNTLADFEHLTKLRELHIRQNKIEDLKQIKYLTNLNGLRVLSLADNPCVVNAGKNYRLHVLHELRNLKFLDTMEVNDFEREDSQDPQYSVVNTTVPQQNIQISHCSGYQIRPLSPVEENDVSMIQSVQGDHKASASLKDSSYRHSAMDARPINPAKQITTMQTDLTEANLNPELRQSPTPRATDGANNDSGINSCEESRSKKMEPMHKASKTNHTPKKLSSLRVSFSTDNNNTQSNNFSRGHTEHAEYRADDNSSSTPSRSADYVTDKIYQKPSQWAPSRSTNMGERSETRIGSYPAAASLGHINQERAATHEIGTQYYEQFPQGSLYGSYPPRVLYLSDSPQAAYPYPVRYNSLSTQTSTTNLSNAATIQEFSSDKKPSRSMAAIICLIEGMRSRDLKILTDFIAQRQRTKAHKSYKK